MKVELHGKNKNAPKGVDAKGGKEKKGEKAKGGSTKLPERSVRSTFGESRRLSFHQVAVEVTGRS